MLDIVDAFVREASASMEYVSHGKTFRKVLTRGLPGSFCTAAITINDATDVMDQQGPRGRPGGTMLRRRHGHASPARWRPPRPD